MVTAAPCDLCFLDLLQKLYELLALIAIGIHTYLAVSQCCVSASSRNSLPDSLFSFFTAAARSSSLLHHHPPCFPQGSNSHRPLRLPHHSIPVLGVPKSPHSSNPTPTVQPRAISLEEGAPGAWEDARVCLFKDSEQLCACLRPESRPLWGWLRATSEQMKQLSWLSTRPHRTPGLWGSGEGPRAGCRVLHRHCHPRSSFRWAAQLSPRSDAFRAAHTPPCWWQRAGRSHSRPHLSLHPLAACSRFWGKNPKWHIPQRLGGMRD